jgi:translation initiation factor 2 alpha subunit (eIF-2alpha)
MPVVLFIFAGFLFFSVAVQMKHQRGLLEKSKKMIRDAQNQDQNEGLKTLKEAEKYMRQIVKKLPKTARRNIGLARLYPSKHGDRVRN